MNALVEPWEDWGTYIRVGGLSTQGEPRAGFSLTMFTHRETRAGFSGTKDRLGHLHACRGFGLPKGKLGLLYSCRHFS
jgi:hypothetical protein